MEENKIDISENTIIDTFGEDILNCLLKEHAYDLDKEQSLVNHHIFWATDNYKKQGKGYQFTDEIKIECITGENNGTIRPRITKTKEQQSKRTRDKAEVFTPSWVCNAQNNLIDNAWFGRENVFNTEIFDNGKHDWIPVEEKIVFPENKSWQEYVNDNRIEMACGEAPYLVSRYDTTTGEVFDSLNKRIGLLDRKLRVVGENVSGLKEWNLWALNAIKATYGFEWQGDNLLLARESVLFTVLDYFNDFVRKNNIRSKKPSESFLLHVANIISWNIFQMDGINMVLPLSCHDKRIKVEKQFDLFEASENEEIVVPCEGCKNKNVHRHNGVYQIVADWNRTKWSVKEKPVEITEFHKLINHD